MSPICREGHLSVELDYCSVCGARLTSAAASPTVCPSCAEPLADPPSRFCAVCRWDFLERRPGPPPIAAIRAPAVEIVITVDPSLDADPDPDHPCPLDAAPRAIALDRPELLVGRFDEARDIRPEVALHDPGVSRRHAKLLLGVQGTVTLQDLASTNGLKRNGEELAPGSRVELADGDTVTLGRWTRLTVRIRA